MRECSLILIESEKRALSCTLTRSRQSWQPSNPAKRWMLY
jgi:hypothetical protein